MQQLTEQQIKNREYYRQNAERIKAKKRQQYLQRKQAAEQAAAAKPTPKRQPAPPREPSTRQRIEDLTIERELSALDNYWDNL